MEKESRKYVLSAWFNDNDDDNDDLCQQKYFFSIQHNKEKTSQHLYFQNYNNTT